MNPEPDNNLTAARVLKVPALLALIFCTLAAAVLLFTLVPLLALGGNVQLDSGGFLDLLLQRTQHTTNVIEARLVFLGALPLLLDALLVLAYVAVVYSYLRRVTKGGLWFFAAGKKRWIAASILSALIVLVPTVTSAAVKGAVAAGGTFAAKPWNPAGGVLLLVLTLGFTVFYIRKTNGCLPVQAQQNDEEENFE